MSAGFTQASGLISCFVENSVRISGRSPGSPALALTRAQAKLDSDEIWQLRGGQNLMPFLDWIMNFEQGLGRQKCIIDIALGTSEMSSCNTCTLYLSEVSSGAHGRTGVRLRQCPEYIWLSACLECTWAIYSRTFNQVMYSAIYRKSTPFRACACMGCTASFRRMYFNDP